MFKGVELGELKIVQFDGFREHPFIGEAPHLQRGVKADCGRGYLPYAYAALCWH